jgi:hypothetical protein
MRRTYITYETVYSCPKCRQGLVPTGQQGIGPVVQECRACSTDVVVANLYKEWEMLDNGARASFIASYEPLGRRSHRDDQFVAAGCLGILAPIIVLAVAAFSGVSALLERPGLLLGAAAAGLAAAVVG